MEEAMELDFSGSTTTTTTITTPALSMDEDAGWADWGSIVDWDSLGPVPEYDDLGGLIDSLMAEYESSNCDLEVSTGLVEPHWLAPVELDEEEMGGVGGGGQEEEDTKGVRLVHLLLAAAEALTEVHRCRDLAGVILVRLNELASPAGATTMERLAAHFTDALRGLLDGCAAGKVVPEPPCQQAEAMAAFQLLQDMSPYVKFGHFTANQAILEAVSGDRRVHVLDYDIMEGVQWASLMQALVSRKGGPPAPHLRITALTRGGGCGRKSVSSVQETGRRLAAFAASIGQPFSFHHCRLDMEENFRPAAVKVVKGEALVVNCMLHFSHRPQESVASFLSGARDLGPRIATLVEEELGPASGPGFLCRFMDSLHQYSALYDSLEAGFPMQSRARALVERVFLGPKIAGSVSRSFRAQEFDECWEDWMVGSGFRPTGISYFNHCQAKLLVGLFNDGYRVEEVGPNKLVLGWKARGLLTASTWAAPAPESPSQLESDYLN